MQVFPVSASTLSEKELCDFIKSKYLLSSDFSCKLFRTGVNHTYFISNNEYQFVVRVYCYQWRSKTEIEQELKLLCLLKENCISVSYPIQDKDGNLIQEINAPEGIRYSVLFSFAQGQKMRFMSNQTCQSIGSLIAKIHNITEHKKINRVNYNSEVLLYQSYDLIKSFFAEDLNEMQYINNISHLIAKRFEAVHLLESHYGIVHLDIWYDNLSFNNENDIIIFDFDNCGNGPLFLDLGYFCKQLFFIETDKDEYESKVLSFLNGYQEIRDLSERELKLIPEAGTAIFIFYLGVQAQRFDWSNIFFTENYLKMCVGRIKNWIDYYENKMLSDNT